MSPRMRADLLLVERGLFESRAKAQAAIAAGLVTAGGIPVRRPSDTLVVDAEIEASPAHPWVSRGGVKLAAALDHFAIDPADRTCLDVGTSTGGFAHVLLARGAAHVHAIDVGHGQLHPSLQGHPRMSMLEGTDIRLLDAARLPALPDLVTIDVSFISLRLVLPVIGALAAPAADLVALIKPQFEAGRAALKKGILRDPAAHEMICDDIAACLAALDWRMLGVIPSPIAGGDGNREFLIGAHRG